MVVRSVGRTRARVAAGGSLKPASSSFQLRFGHRFSGRLQINPLCDTLMTFGPVGRLLGNHQREQIDRQYARRAETAVLDVAEGAERGRTDDAAHAALLPRLDRRRLVVRPPRHQIALGHDPAAGVARGDEQHLGLAIGTDAIGQRSDLIAHPDPPGDAGGEPAARRAIMDWSRGKVMAKQSNAGARPWTGSCARVQAGRPQDLWRQDEEAQASDAEKRNGRVGHDPAWPRRRWRGR